MLAYCAAAHVMSPLSASSAFVADGVADTDHGGDNGHALAHERPNVLLSPVTPIPKMVELPRLSPPAKYCAMAPASARPTRLRL